MRKCPHTSTNRGRRVRIVKRDGTVLEGKFVERLSRYVVLDTGRVATNEIHQFIVPKVA